MTPITCRKCKLPVNEDAERCPHCGAGEPGRRSGGTPVLVSTSQLHRPKVQCRACGQRVPVGAALCPSCGKRNPTANTVRRLLPLALSLLPAIALAAAWQFGLLADLTPRSSLESGLQPTDDPRRAAPRIASPRFSAGCEPAAPVYVRAVDNTPSTFLVLIADSVPEPASVSDSLTRRYRLRSPGYDPALGGFFVEDAAPAAVSGLRCEPAVRALEEDPGVSR